MVRDWAEAAVSVLTAYATVGLLFGLAFVVRGVQEIDPAARGVGWRFRLLILPGAAALWPLLAWRWLRSAAEAPTDDPTDGNPYAQVDR